MTANASGGSFISRSIASDRFARIWHLIIAVLLISFVALLARQTFLRAVFPWDMHIWSESPFMTSMLKLENGQPLFASPAEANSFVYSPALEYLTFAILKPFGTQLDIRYCRLVNIAIGLGAAAFGALAIKRLGRACPEFAMGYGGFLATWAAFVLVLFKNFTADIPHPDNLHAFQALLVLYLCFCAVESKSFGLALASMVVAGLGVLAKQTDAACAAGPAAAFLILKIWDRPRLLILIAVGVIVSGLALWCLWMPQYARFYTFELLSHQPRYFNRIFRLTGALLLRERGMLALLGGFAAFYLWRRRDAARRYVICVLAVGVAAATLTTAAYIKEFGTWNNLGALQMFLALLVWPMVWSFPRWLTKLPAPAPPGHSATALIFGTSALALVIFLRPDKLAPTASYYEYCDTISRSVQKDIVAGHKVMVSHGTEFLIRAGSRDVPMDRANSYLELAAAKATNLVATRSRICAHYYDRIYLIKDFGFDSTLTDVFHQSYQVIDTVPAYQMEPMHDFFRAGYQYNLRNHCEILAPRVQQPARYE